MVHVFMTWLVCQSVCGVAIIVGAFVIGLVLTIIPKVIVLESNNY